MASPSTLAAAADPVEELTQGIEHLGTCSKRHKTRLFVGEGDLSFAVAYYTKHKTNHPNIGESLIVTEYRTPSDFLCRSCEGQNALFNSQGPRCDDCRGVATRIDERQTLLREAGATVLWGIDATCLSDYKDQWQEREIQCVHWNIPHDGSRRPSDTMPTLMSKFFTSCITLLKPSAHVHVSIGQPPGKESWYQAGIHGLLDAATESGFTLHKKRRFVDVSMKEDDLFGSPCKLPNGTVKPLQRYPGYRHIETARNGSASVIGKGAREFVFSLVAEDAIPKLKLTQEVKTSSDAPRALGLMRVSSKEYGIYNTSFSSRGTRCYYSAKGSGDKPPLTDSESSGCSEDEGE